MVGLEAIVVGAGITLLSLFAASWADHPVPQDKSDYHWAFVQGYRWPALIAKYVGIPLGVIIIAFGLIASLVSLVA
jgi:hypothetical protein